jgi:hypothetical protein
MRFQRKQPMCKFYHIALVFSLFESAARFLMTLTLEYHQYPGPIYRLLVDTYSRILGQEQI